MTFLIFSFDGSGRDPESGIQEEKYGGKKSDNNITNVVKLHLLCGGNLFPDGPNYGLSTRNNIDGAFYYPGVGRYGNKLQQLVNLAVAPEDQDVATVIRKARQDLLNSLPDDCKDLVILLTGYSRGAALARRFATIVHRHFETKDNAPNGPFIYLCVWDTVASIGMPDLSTGNRPKYDVVFEEGYTLSESVHQASHMVSLDDKRRSFQPTLMNFEPDRILEVWFCGAHGDTGGGYYYDGLSDITLDHAIKWLQKMYQHHALPEIDFRLPEDEKLDKACPVEVRTEINRDDLQINPNPMGKNHQQDRLPVIEWATLYDRICCVVKENKIDYTLKPLVHWSVPVRIYRDQRYNPVSLSRMGTEHKIWYDYDAEQPAYKGIQPHQELTEHNWQILAPGQSVEVIVEADRKFNHSGIQVTAGERYTISVDDDQTWHDADIPCNAEGWDRDDITKGLKEWAIAAAEPFRRIPEVNWFYLCAAIGTDENSYMKIGKHRQINVPQTGELTFFANDLDSRYHNNWGSIGIRVTRTG